MKLKNFFLSCSSASRSRKLKDEQQRFTANGNGNNGNVRGSRQAITSSTSLSSSGQRDQRPMSPTVVASGSSSNVKETDLVEFVQDNPKKSLSAVYSYGNSNSSGSVNKLTSVSASGRIPGYHNGNGSSTSLAHPSSNPSSGGGVVGGSKYYSQSQGKRITEGGSGAGGGRASTPGSGGGARHHRSGGSERERERSAVARERDAYQQHYQYYQQQNGHYHHGGGGDRGVTSYGNSKFYDDCYHNHHHHSHNNHHSHSRYSSQHSQNNNKTSPRSAAQQGNGGGGVGGGGRRRNSSSEDERNHYQHQARQNNYGDFGQTPANLGVKKGDRVVWVREPPESNECGIVRWTGVIEGEEIAGIEFDRPLGLGSGWYKNRQLFTCAPQKGGLVAIAGLILEDDYYFNPEISTKEGDEDIVVSAVSTGGEISPVRGDSSLSASSGIGSGSGIHSSPSPSPSSSSSTSLDVGSYDTSSSTSSTSSTRNKNNNSQRYNHLHNLQEDSSSATITVSKSNIASSKSANLFDRPSQSEKNAVGAWSSPNQQLLPTVDCGDGPVLGAGRVTQWTGGSSKGKPSHPSSEKEGEHKETEVFEGSGANMPIPFVQAPLREEDADRISGRSKGIQGHRNSCYLDATLFAMFSFSSVFDTILLQDWNGQKDDGDEELARDVQRILRDDVVNPLRKEMYCTARNVMKLREKMQHLDDKLTSEEMDPQEFLQLLFHKVLNLEEFMSLSSGHSDFFHQVLVAQTEEDKNKIPTIQQLFEQSLIMQELKLKTVPRPALILQMPRSGNKYKMYEGILPNLSIDITDLMEDIPRMCIICGSLATHECSSCYGKFSSGGEARDNSSSATPSGSGAESTAFCETCLNQTHKRRDRQHHLNLIVPIKYSFDPSQYFNLSPLSPTSTTGTTNNSVNNHHHLNNHLHHHNNSNAGAIPSYHFGASASSWATGGTTGGSGFVGGNPSFNRNPSSNAPLISSIPSPPSSHHAVVSSSRSIPRVTMDLFAVICIETSHFVSFVKCGTERQAPWVFFDSMADRVENPNGTGHNIPQVKLLPHMGKWLEELEKSPKNIKELMTSESQMTPELRRLLSDPYICLYYSPQACMYS